RFEMESGVPVFFDSIQNAGTREAGFGIQLVGTEGIIDFRADAEPLAHLMKGSPFRPRPEPRQWVPITSAGVGKPEPIEDIRAQVGGHVGAARDLIAAIREKREPLCSAKDGRVEVEMTMAVFESHIRNGERVEIPLTEREGNPLSRW
ncbi:MAG: gfo/Idh/MocA family oxidoreductase, partial [Verrucomicrobiae bacterium]|nr:gfo/Idh/MocA family oxidoreductase [Verrucomicrobiae bacterium]